MFSDSLPRPFFVLAPMDDVTDTVFRQIVYKCSPPDLFFTEFVNVDGLQSPGRPKLLHKLQFSVKEKPIIAQIWGKTADNFYKTAGELVDMGFAGVDLNMGCPVKTVVKNGCCAALINNRELAGEIIKATKKGVNHRIPVSVKTRIGFDDINMDWIKFLLDQQIDMLTIHGRTAKQLSKVQANWDAIGEAVILRDKIRPKTLIVGNGDVLSISQGRELTKKHKLDGIMIGRGIFNDPFCFSDKSPWANYTKKQKIKLYLEHINLFARTWEIRKPNIRVLNKFCKIYIEGFDGAKELREKCMSADNLGGLVNLLQSALLQ